jgi:FlaA1/EpsC-like NDP-sugar epimerase
LGTANDGTKICDDLGEWGVDILSGVVARLDPRGITWRGRRVMTRLVALGRYQKRTLLVVNDVLILSGVLWVAISARYGRPFVPPSTAFAALLALAPVIAVLTFFQMGLYKLVTRFVGGRSINRIALAVGLSVTVWALILFLSGISGVPRLSLVAYWAGGTMGVWGSRQIAGWLLKTAGIPIAADVFEARRRVLIYGAGTSGVQLAVGLVQSDRYEMVGFIDHNPGVWGQYIAGHKVRRPEKLEDLINHLKVDDVFLASPEMERGERVHLLRRLEKADVNVRIVPEMADIASGRVLVTDLRPVDAIDLLGRSAVAPNLELLKAPITGRSVMVTGAGGSIGSELVRQIVTLEPRRLVLFDASETALYEIQSEVLRAVGPGVPPFHIQSVLGSVCDASMVEAVLKDNAVETIFHAAAFKHVPIVEENLVAGFENNTFGTVTLARAAAAFGVNRFVLISTDKAVRPSSMMGASKRLAEMALQALAGDGKSQTIFTMVRFGNVLDSSGSVIRLFRRQIETGGPMTVTHKDMIRYFMSIPEAASLVIQAGAMANGGELYVLDMGDPIKIDDIARSMIRLSGRTVRDENNPTGDVEITYIGLRPGEKLREELLIANAIEGTQHPRILKCQEPSLPTAKYDAVLARLRSAMAERSESEIRSILAETIEQFAGNEVLPRDTAVRVGAVTSRLVH